MKHGETVRIVPGAKHALLLIHGIVGTPNHFVSSIPLMDWVPEGWSVRNLLLPGHGGSVSDFAGSSMKQWRDAARSAFLELAEGHEKVCIAAHSMGTLFALELAVEFPGKIPALFLLGVPMRPRLAPAAVNSALRLALGKLRPGYPEMAIVEACGTAPTWKLWRYIPWLPRFLELFAQIRRTEKKLGDLRVRTVVFQSRRDELVSGASEKVLRRFPGMEIRILEGSSHFYYSPADQERIRLEFEKLLQEVRV